MHRTASAARRLVPLALLATAPLALAAAAAAQDPAALAAQPFHAAPDEHQAYTPYVAPASDEGREAMKRFQLPEGLAVDLFAAEPMLANPVCLYVDDQGQVYVGETFRHSAGVTDIRNHMDWLDEDLANKTVEDRVAMIARHEGANFSKYSEEQDRVRLIRDLDGDHHADVATVFADGFDDPAAGIGAGILANHGDVYYTCIPDLWLLRDEDGDGHADVKKKLYTGFGVNVSLLGHDMHGLRIGPDRRLYFSIGDRGLHVQTPNGVLDLPKRGGVLRCELDGSDLEIWHTGLRNPQELVFDEYGNLWTGDNNSDGGDQARWVAIVEGGDSGWRYPYQWITEPNLRGPWNDEKMWYPHFDGQAAFIVPPVADLGNGPSGLTYYPGTGLGDRWKGHFFLADFRGAPAYSGVHTFTVRPKGAYWELGPVEPFVWKALVTDCDFGPDGDFYFTDWVEGWNKTGKGRVYRVYDPARVGDEEALATKRILAEGMTGRDTAALQGLLSNPDQRVRQEAEFALVDRGADGLAVLAKAAAASDDLLARLHGIWGIGVVGRKDPSVLDQVVPLLDDADPEVRAQAVRVLGDDRYAPATDAIVARIADEAPRVRFFAAIAAGRLRAHGAIDALHQLLLDAGSQDDAYLRHAAVMGLLGSANVDDIDRFSLDSSADVRMGALLVLRRLAEPAIARFLADPDPNLVFEAVRAIYDVPIAGLEVALSRVSLPPKAPNGLVRRVMNACFREGSAASAAQLARLISRKDLAAKNRVEGLALLGEWEHPSPRDHVTNFWRPLPSPRELSGLPELATELGKRLASAPPAVRAAWCALAGANPSPGSQALLAARVADTGEDSAVRVAALEALQASGAPDLAKTVDLALGDTDGELRAAGLAALERLAPADALPRVGGILKTGELSERRAAYRILGHAGGDTATALIVSELEKLQAGYVPEELALDLVLAAEENGSDAAHAILSKRSEARAADPEMAPYLDGLLGGDAGRGRKVFEDTELSCVRCHATDDTAGTTVGPDLRGVSRRLGRVQILESIVHPNRRTTPGYQSTVLFFGDDSSLSGRILEEGVHLDGEEGTWLRIIDSNGDVHEVAEADVVERRPDLSAMPEDLAAKISREKMRDLIAYLETL